MKYKKKIVIMYILLGTTKTLTRAEQRSGGLTILIVLEKKENNLT